MKKKKRHYFSFLIQVLLLKLSFVRPCSIFPISSSKKTPNPGLKHHFFLRHNTIYLLNACWVLVMVQQKERTVLRSRCLHSHEHHDIRPRELPERVAAGQWQMERLGDCFILGGQGRHPQGGDVCSRNLTAKKEMANWTPEERACQVDRAASAEPLSADPGGEGPVCNIA